MSEESGEHVHDACPGEWCSTIACFDCGEMLTNPKPKHDGLVGICPHHGRYARGVIMRREDCLIGGHIGGTSHG